MVIPRLGLSGGRVVTPNIFSCSTHPRLRSRFVRSYSPIGAVGHRLIAASKPLIDTDSECRAFVYYMPHYIKSKNIFMPSIESLSCPSPPVSIRGGCGRSLAGRHPNAPNASRELRVRVFDVMCCGGETRWVISTEGKGGGGNWGSASRCSRT